VAALGSPVRRAVAPSYSSRAAGTLKRRLVVGLLVLASLAMITVYFRESPSGGGLHGFQSAAASAMRPFEVAAQRVARPFRDAYGWVHGLYHAKSENEDLHKEVDRLRQEAIRNATAAQENRELSRILKYRRGLTFPEDFPAGKSVTASVVSNPASEFEQKIVISAGSSSGVGLHDAVVTERGLVGQVTKVVHNEAQVTLITDKEAAVAARDHQHGAVGVLRQGPSDNLILDLVGKDRVVVKGDQVVTAGRRQGQLPSLYPRDIPIGRVTSVEQSDIESYQDIQVMPFVDFSSLDVVLVLVSDKPRPRMP